MLLPGRSCLHLLLLLLLLCWDLGLALTDKIKLLSFGGNGNIGSAVLSRLIKTGQFEIVMTTRGGWHWDSDSRIGNRQSV